MRMPTHDARAVSLVRHCEEKPEILIIRGSVREEKSYKSEEVMEPLIFPCLDLVFGHASFSATR